MTASRRIVGILAIGVVVVVGVVVAALFSRETPGTRLSIVTVISTANGNQMTLRRGVENTVLAPPRLSFTVTLLSNINRVDVVVTLTIKPPTGDGGRIIQRRRRISLAENRPTPVALRDLLRDRDVPFAQLRTLSVTVGDMKRHETATGSYPIIFALA
jgi:hypothetical protein